MLWEHIYGPGGEDQYISLFSAFRVTGEKTLQQEHIQHYLWPEEADKASAWLDAKSREGREVYICAHLVLALPGKDGIPRPRRLKEHAAPLLSLYVDGDGATVPDHLPAPTAVVRSSPGREQFYWRLSRPVSPEIGEELNRRLAYAMRADLSGWDLTQLLRPPGTPNHKYPDTPTVTLTYLDDTTAYDPDELDRILPILPARPTTSKAYNGDEPPVNLTGEALQWWSGAKPAMKPDGQIDRSSTLFVIGKYLYRAGATARTIADALAERDTALGYRCYTDRADARRQYENAAVNTIAAVDAGDGINATFTAHKNDNGTHPPSGDEDESQPPPTSWPLSDLGNAERLAAKCGADLRYCDQWKKWLVWDGKRWKADVTREAFSRAKKTVRGMYAEAAAIEDDKGREAVAKHALRSESGKAIREMIALAQSESGIPVVPDDLDADNWRLNVLNGTIDLRTGELHPHDRRELHSKIVPIAYDPDATLPLWDEVLRTAMDGNEAHIAFLRRIAGYSLTGDVGEEVLFLVHGPGAASKSTFIDAVKMAAGEYGMTADFETFLKRRDTGTARPDIARLAGARFVASIEVDEGKSLAEGLVKTLTGGDVVTARRLYQEAFEFRPAFKLWLVANDAPFLRDDDDALWRRIIRVPFTHVIPKEKRDPAVKAKLTNPAIAGPAILAWAVKGCLEWQRIGLNVPKSITESTEKLRQDMNPLRDFLADCCVLSSDKACKSAELLHAYEMWCKENGIPEAQRIGGRAFAARLKQEKCEPTRTTSGRGWAGIGLLTASFEL